SAHLDHLALYAGANGYPRSNTYDPRHFASIKGKAVYVEQLSGAWATDAQYAGKILKLKSEIEDFKSYKMWIESPSNGANVNGTIDISGWALDSSGINDVKLYVDDEFVKNIESGLSRPDVENLNPGYTDGIHSGFQGKLDTNTLTSGNHTIKVKVTAKDGTKQEQSREIKINKRKEPRIWIDNPRGDVDGKVKVEGWSLNDTGVKDVKLYVDGKYNQTLTSGLIRSDVNNAYPGYYDGIHSGFQGEIDSTKLSAGEHALKVISTGNDGTKSESSVTIKRSKKESKVWIDSPRGTTESEEVTIKGWALDSSGVDKVNLYVNGDFDKELASGLVRSDVNNAYPGYYDGLHSGFEGKINLNKYPKGSINLKVEVIHRDGSKQYSDTNINNNKKDLKMWIDSPNDGIKVTDKLTVEGWALNPSGVKEVRAYVDGKFVTKIKSGIVREDVNSAYPGYKDGNKSGFKDVVSINDIAPGNHTLKIVVEGNDGTSDARERSINISKKEPKMYVENPSGTSNVNNELSVSGWAINASGLERVNLYIDGKYVDSTTDILNRYDVANVYPEYKNSEKSGFDFNIDLSKFDIGYHVIRVEAVGNDVTLQSSERGINITRKAPKMYIEGPVYNSEVKDSLNIFGWALNDSGIKEVKTYVDGKYIKTITSKLIRYDVANAYPGYKDGIQSGYEGSIDFKGYKNGTYVIKVEAIGNDGSKDYRETLVRKNNGKIIVLDPGHRLFGADTGTTGKHNGVTYNEAELDLQLAMKTKSELENRGYNVVMTQTLNNMIAADTIEESLRKRVEIAENNKADIFVSIHHNSYDNSNAYGTEVWYSNPKKNPQVGATKAGQELAGKVATSIAKEGGFYNRGSKENDWYVTYNTTMPSILVEAGFLTNPNDAKKAASSSNQQKVARGMSSTIDTFIKNR
ncbi:N-acetylmuramoyl-L-alanine amidase, partial [Clostridium chrysemydis]|uniref:N-acetylmuramoyl-L-alanine amidase n=1 Tax=Clostridium chrysemydis TaxID=2665504 RepID=UPI003F35CA9F